MARCASPGYSVQQTAVQTHKRSQRAGSLFARANGSLLTFAQAVSIRHRAQRCTNTRILYYKGAQGVAWRDQSTLSPRRDVYLLCMSIIHAPSDAALAARDKHTLWNVSRPPRNTPFKQKHTTRGT